MFLDPFEEQGHLELQAMSEVVFLRLGASVLGVDGIHWEITTVGANFIGFHLQKPTIRRLLCHDRWHDGW